LSSFGSGRRAVWTDEDAEIALAWDRRQRLSCRSCGTRAEEWAADRFAYVPTARACPGCELLSQERRGVREEAREYVHIGLIPKALAEELDDERA
jgi:hypothetical protein